MCSDTVCFRIHNVPNGEPNCGLMVNFNEFEAYVVYKHINVPTAQKNRGPTWRRVDLFLLGYEFMAEDFIDGKQFGVVYKNKLILNLLSYFFGFCQAFRDTGPPPKFVECSSCGRSFNPTVLVSNVFICLFVLICCTVK